MQESNQTSLPHQSVNAAGTDDILATGLSSSPSTEDEDGGIYKLLQILAEIGELSTEDSSVEAPALFYPSAGNEPVEEPFMHQWLSDYDATAIDYLVDAEDDSVLNDNPTDADDDLAAADDDRVIDDDLAAAEDDRYQIIGEQSASPPALSRPDRSRLYRQPAPLRNPNELFVWTTVQTFICIALLAVLWTFVFMTMVFGVKEIGTIRIGMGCSLLLKPNRFFVETIKVEQPSNSNVGPALYGFNYRPPLDVVSSWSDAHNASLQANIHKEWVYLLNEGSQINISYNVPNSSRLLLMIDRGRYGYGQWLYDRSSPNTTLSWNIIHGNGLIQQNILLSGRYHITVGNLNSWEEEVQLNISARAFIYDTSNAYYQCKSTQGRCVFHLLFPEANYAVLTTPQLKQGTCDGECQWHVKLTYGPRFTTYFGGILVINGVMALGIHPLLERRWMYG